jgi:hypothetical protein
MLLFHVRLSNPLLMSSAKLGGRSCIKTIDNDFGNVLYILHTLIVYSVHLRATHFGPEERLNDLLARKRTASPK